MIAPPHYRDLVLQHRLFSFQSGLLDYLDGICMPRVSSVTKADHSKVPVSQKLADLVEFVNRVRICSRKRASLNGTDSILN
ncbi:unnamed protein product [Protopolystoma xenopodis]|uniref:Uncharacterized protein n=1 Tax=Protopolystoma xenopodis TaxID=117903 RepID=A0A448WFL1_9PLAT|nr:unnamed protein product [Protopolystoma xenopodis]